MAKDEFKLESQLQIPDSKILHDFALLRMSKWNLFQKAIMICLSFTIRPLLTWLISTTIMNLESNSMKTFL